MTDTERKLAAEIKRLHSIIRELEEENQKLKEERALALLNS